MVLTHAVIRRSASVFLVLSILVAFTSPVAGQTSTTLVDLGSFAATGNAVAECSNTYAGSAAAINDAGAVTGKTAWGERSSTTYRATDGTLKRLKSGKGGGGGLDINTSGQIAGYVVDDLGDNPCSMEVLAGQTGAHHAATWVGNKLQLLPDDGAYSEATVLNDDGLIAGVVNHLPVVWRDGKRVDLPLPDGAASGAPIDINADGQIIGYVSDAKSENMRRVLWDGEDVTVLPDGFAATAINDAGDIVGSINEGEGIGRLANGTVEPLKGTPTDVAGLGAVAMTETGTILLSVRTESGTNALLWQDGETTEIASLLPADSALTDLTAVDLTDTGHILITATASDGTRHGLVLTTAP